MKSFLTVLALIACLLSAEAQKPYSISGAVRDINSEPIAGATVSLFKSNDTVACKNIFTDNKGRFSFINVPQAQYTIGVFAAGHITYRNSVSVGGNTGIILPPVILSAIAKDLTEVKVNSKKPLIVQDIDKTIVNVDAMIGSAAGNTLEVLQKAPGVIVNSEDDIMLNGKAGVLVLIDGRNTYMSAKDLGAYLKSLPGGALDKIELITNPAAKYDAAGGAIINIRLKKSKLQGFNGGFSLSYNQGIEARTYDALNVSFTAKKITVFGNLAYGRNASVSTDLYDRTFYTAGIRSASLNLNSHLISKSSSVNGRMGMDYTLSPKTTAGFIFTLNTRPQTENTDYKGSNFNASGALDSISSGKTDSRSNWTNTGINLNLTHKFNEKGRELSADLNYINYTANGNQVLPNVAYSPDGTTLSSKLLLYTLPSSVNIYTAKADYSHPFNKNATIEAGIKSSLVKNNNEYSYFNVIGNTNMPDYSKSNHFLYNENISAVYVSAKKDWKRIGVQAGLRLENTATYGHQPGNIATPESAFRKNYTKLFPTAFFSYKIDSLGRHTLTASYAKRLQRPGYQDLNPFVFYKDKYSYSTGNPGLNPASNYHLELNYRHQQYFGIGIQYDHVKDIVFQTTTSSDNIFISRPANIANGQFIGLSANGSASLTKWWKFNPWLFAAHVINKGKIGSENLNQTINHLGTGGFNEFTFSKNWSGEIDGLYLSRLIAGQVIYESRFRLNTAVKVKILKGKGNLKLSLSDIFHSWKQNESIVSIGNASSFRYNSSDTRNVALSLNYNFGKDLFARKRNHNDNAADDEKGRVK